MFSFSKTLAKYGKSASLALAFTLLVAGGGGSY